MWKRRQLCGEVLVGDVSGGGRWKMEGGIGGRREGGIRGREGGIEGGGRVSEAGVRERGRD